MPKRSTRSKQLSFHSSRTTVGTPQRTSQAMGVSAKLVKSSSQDNDDLCSQARRSETMELKAKSSPQMAQLVPKQSYVPQKHSPHQPDVFEDRSSRKAVGSVAHKSALLGLHVPLKSSTDVTAHDIDHKQKLSQDEEEGFHIQQHGSVC